MVLFVSPPGRSRIAQNPTDAEPEPVEPATPNQIVIHYIQKEIFIPAPLAFPNGLDAIEVYADRPGRHPLVVLTHGTSDKEEERARVTPWAQLGQAMWFARRGYVAIVVARRGYGRSGGQRDGNAGGCRARGGSFKDAGEASADDLRAVIKFGQGLPEVDPETVVSIGISTGGFAQVALSANPPPALKAAINFAGGRGGDGHEHNCDLSGVVGAYESFGKAAHKHGDLPMLWIYAQNDHWFTPAMAQQFEAAYNKSGATEQFVLAPPDRDEGHHLYSHISAWSDTVNAFLKAHNLLPLGDDLLPAPQPPNVPESRRAARSGRTGVETVPARRALQSICHQRPGSMGSSHTPPLTSKSPMAMPSTAAKRPLEAAGNCAIVARTPGVK